MKKYKIGVIGLGYVGLPLAVAFAEKYQTIGFDINISRVNDLKNGNDRTLEISDNDLKSVLINKTFGEKIPEFNEGFFPTNIIKDISNCNVYIVTVPTPTDKNNRPVLIPLIKASETIGSILKKGDMIIYESTVYPGVTEDECVPILEKVSGLKFNKDFFVGYSPERINPGDKEHTVKKIRKITSGSTKESSFEIDNLYKSIISAGTYLAPSIKVAEAAKVIENSQRDINIAFINELAKIFSLLGIDTHEVLKAAGTKWNFLSFKPGLVGGHCIGVDPYYLAQKAQEHGYHPEIILAGRRINDSMGKFVASEVIKLMIKRNFNIRQSKVLMLGVTFKEDCPDIRNSKAIDVYNELLEFGTRVDVYDPWANAEEVKNTFNIDLIERVSDKYQAIILAVSHNEFLQLNIRSFLEDQGLLYDVKGILEKDIIDSRL